MNKTNQFLVIVLAVVLAIGVGYFLAPGGSPQVNGVEPDQLLNTLYLGKQYKLSGIDYVVFCGLTASDGSYVISVTDRWGGGYSAGASSYNIYIRGTIGTKPNVWIDNIEYKIASVDRSKIVLEKVG